eukprot:403343777
MFTKRGASIGYGKRFGDLLSKSVAPSPQLYNVPNIKDPKQYSFGESRDKFEKVYIKENPPRDKNVPGPGAYTVKQDYTIKGSAAYSMRPNSNYASMFNDPTKKFPGPGQYNGQSATENKNGFTVQSKYKSSGAVAISKGGQRFDHRVYRNSMEIPGPGKYYQAQLKQSLTRHYGTAIFGKERRLVEQKSTSKLTPGPGAYRIQSDFGFYDPSTSINADKSFSGHSRQKSAGR